jgi:CRISPR system Cascade subunit CasD
MGIPRSEDRVLTNLNQLKMGVRVDREGTLKVDYHTAKHVLKASGGMKETELSTRYYLADALFLVGLEGDDELLLQRIHKALYNPTWPLFLGRKSFVPGEPVWLEDGLKPHVDLKNALKSYRYLSDRPAPENLRLVIEDTNGALIRADQPLSFAMNARQFGPRRITIEFISSASIFSTSVQEVT